jgi:hypothetical protein
MGLSQSTGVENETVEEQREVAFITFEVNRQLLLH